MGKFLKILLFLLLAGFLASTNVSADTITFGDNNINWPGWDTGITTDTHGTPDMLGGEAEVTNGYLTKLTFQAQAIYSKSLFNTLTAGGLFIDNNADAIWDYYADSYQKKDPASLDLYHISQPLKNSSTDGDYIVTATSGYRNGHPVALKDSFLAGKGAGTVGFSGWPTVTNLNDIVDITFLFGNSQLLLGSNFTIGFGPMCANDVIYETMENPVPEPATMLLLGFGLIGLAGVGRKKFKKLS